MRQRMLILAATLIGAPVFAHDFWLQPRDFVIDAPRMIALNMFVGHGPDRQRWGVKIDRVIQFVSFGPEGKIDRKNELTLGARTGDGVMRFGAPGTHVLALQSSTAQSDLPAVRYNSYAKLEGLTVPLALRAKQGRTNDNGREIYSRRAKAIVQIGPIDAHQSAIATHRLGLTLEIVAKRNPLALKPGEPLPVQIFFNGRPLAGALVKLTNLDADALPVETHVSDRDGRASFNVPRQGRWLVNTIWSTPITGNANADYETIFSSLTFGYPDAG